MVTHPQPHLMESLAKDTLQDTLKNRKSTPTQTKAPRASALLTRDILSLFFWEEGFDKLMSLSCFLNLDFN